MSIGFTFTGRVKKPEHLLETARTLARERYYNVFDWKAPEKEEAGLVLTLCPLGGEVRLSWKKEPGLFGQWAVEGQCQSTPAGPGFHKAAAELVDALGLQRLAVEDETEYFQHRDFDRMCQEHFYPWLKTMVDMLDSQFGPEHSHVCICWDIDGYMPADVPGTVVTPVGRFSTRWMRETVDEKGIEALAERFFLWYHPGRRDALYDRQLALNLLWESCWYAPSERDPEDADVNQAICDNLEMAARLDPSLPLPRRAYEEVCALAGRTPVLPDGPALEEEFYPGYRKGLVIYALGPLRLTLPGRYRFEWEDWDENSGCHKWADSSSHSPIWRVNGYKLHSGAAAFTPVLEGDNDLNEFQLSDGAVRTAWRELNDEDKPYYQVRAEVIAGPSLFVISVTHQSPEERPGILELLNKIAINMQDVQKHTVQADP